MGAAYITYLQVAGPGQLGYGVTGTGTFYDTLAVLTGSSQTLAGGSSKACPFKSGGVARCVAPDDTTVWNFGTTSSTPDAASLTRQLIVIPAGTVEYIHVPYGAYAAVKTA